MHPRLTLLAEPLSRMTSMNIYYIIIHHQVHPPWVTITIMWSFSMIPPSPWMRPRINLDCSAHSMTANTLDHHPRHHPHYHHRLHRLHHHLPTTIIPTGWFLLLSMLISRLISQLNIRRPRLPRVVVVSIIINNCFRTASILLIVTSDGQQQVNHSPLPPSVDRWG